MQKTSKNSLKLSYGRIGEVEETTLKDFAKTVKDKLGSDGVLVVGDDNKQIKFVAIIAGSGNSLTEMIELAKNKGADVLVSGDIQDSRARFANEIGLAIVDAGDYYTENPGAKKLAEILQDKVPEIKTIHLDPGPAWKII